MDLYIKYIFVSSDIDSWVFACKYSCFLPHIIFVKYLYISNYTCDGSYKADWHENNDLSTNILFVVVIFLFVNINIVWKKL